MANAIYPLYKQAILEGASNVDVTAGTLTVALVDTDTYTYSATHQFLSDLSGIVGAGQAIENVTAVNGLVDGDNVTFPNTTGAESEALVFYINTGSAATSRLFAFIDTGATGLPVIPNGGNIDTTWDAAGIVQL